jgi:hypothetical protein
MVSSHLPPIVQTIEVCGVLGVVMLYMRAKHEPGSREARRLLWATVAVIGLAVIATVLHIYGLGY